MYFKYYELNDLCDASVINACNSQIMVRIRKHLEIQYYCVLLSSLVSVKVFDYEAITLLLRVIYFLIL